MIGLLHIRLSQTYMYNDLYNIVFQPLIDVLTALALKNMKGNNISATSVKFGKENRFKTSANSCSNSDDLAMCDLFIKLFCILYLHLQ